MLLPTVGGYNFGFSRGQVVHRRYFGPEETAVVGDLEERNQGGLELDNAVGRRQRGRYRFRIPGYPDLVPEHGAARISAGRRRRIIPPAARARRGKRPLVRIGQSQTHLR